MGINIILPLIMGIAMTVIIGSQVVPSFVEQMKVAKVENRTISNQNLIKDAIVRYIKMEKKVPKDNDLKVLKDFGLLKDYHESNIFGGGYGFTINKKKGTLKISTTINDKDAGKYFSNSFKFPNAPTCKQALDSNGVCVSGEFETFYLLDEDTFKSIPIPEVGSIEDIEDRFTKVEEVGEKFDGTTLETTLVDGAKDYIVDITKNQVTEYVYDKDKNEWKPNLTPINVGGFGKETGVFINSELEIPYHEWNETEKKLVRKKYKHEKVHCKGIDTTLLGPLGKEFFVINENTGLGEIVWVSPFYGAFGAIQTKINKGFTPNNICTSNFTDMTQMFHDASSFNQPLNRWDVSNVTVMKNMFHNASNFNQDISSWDVSNVTNMNWMFGFATSFNNFDKPLNGWDVSSVKYMSSMFEKTKVFNQALDNWNVGNVTNMNNMFAYSKFNGDISHWDVSKVINMAGMFESSIFNQALNDWDVRNVTNMYGMFYDAKSFNQDLSKWCVERIKTKPKYFDDNTPAWQKELQPQWGTCP